MQGHLYLFSTMTGPSLSIKTPAKLQKVLQHFTDVDMTAYNFLTLLLNEPTFNNHPCMKTFLETCQIFLQPFSSTLNHQKISEHG